MVNIFKIKRLVSYIIQPIITLTTFIIFILFGWGLLWSIIFSVIMSIVTAFAMHKWTKHPIISALEGDGIVVLNIDSKGVIKFMLGKIFPELDTVKIVLPNRKELIFKRDELTYLLFGSDIGLPVLLYNENLSIPLTKEDLANKEKMYIEHIALEILHKSSELSKHMRDFARYVIEQMRPKRFSLDWKIILIIIIIFIVIMFIIVGLGMFTTPMVKVPIPTNHTIP